MMIVPYRLMAPACICLALLAGCEGEPASSRQEASSLTVFDLTPAEMRRLSASALAGDAEAAYRLSQFYTFAGGEGDPNATEPYDKAQERHWLAVAASGGHKVAAFNLAIVTTDVDCPRARRMMTRIALDSLDPDEAASARSWLEDQRFDCSIRRP